MKYVLIFMTGLLLKYTRRQVTYDVNAAVPVYVRARVILAGNTAFIKNSTVVFN